MTTIIHRCTYEVGMSIASRCQSRCKKEAIQFVKSRRFADISDEIYDAFCEDHQFKKGHSHEMFWQVNPIEIDRDTYSAERQKNPRIYYNSGVEET